MTEYGRCICGQEVAVPHKECMALLTPKQRRDFDRGHNLIGNPYPELWDEGVR